MTDTRRAAADWLGETGLRLPPGVVLSFQRYELPASGVIDRAPASLGALPVALSRDGELLLPLAPRECFWIGLTSDAAQPLSLSVAVERDDGSATDVLSGAPWNAADPACAGVPGVSRIDGVRRADGCFEPLLRDDGSGRGRRGRGLRFIVNARGATAAPLSATLEFVDYADFSARSGSPPPAPLDRDAGYKGWLLP
ncbi:MAG TPA: hypothetical protein PLE54_09965 [Burkholderiaceae bacterium]|nr:hypothetical protein [Burkholderiaceae bacterium]